MDSARCVVIEDSRIGLAAAKAAGMRCACLLLPCCAGLCWRACWACWFDLQHCLVWLLLRLRLPAGTHSADLLCVFPAAPAGVW